VLGPAAAGAATLVETRDDALGRTWVLAADHAPFPFEGMPWTDNTVLVFVPRGFVAPGGANGQVDMLWFFHGNDNTVHSAWKRHGPHRQLVESGRNAILVAPQLAVKAHDSRAGKLETTGGFGRLTAEVLAFLAARKVLPNGTRSGRVVLSGHSGGFQPAAKSADLGGVDVHEIILLDAMYGFSRRFGQWIAGGKSRRFVSWYAGRLPTKWTRKLLTRLDRARISYRHLKRDSDLTDEVLRTERLVFVRTQTGHSAVTRYLQRALSTSGLRPIPK